MLKVALGKVVHSSKERVMLRLGGGGGTLGPLFHEYLLTTVFESSDRCSNALATDKLRTFMSLDTVFTQIEAHRERVESCMSTFSMNQKHTHSHLPSTYLA